MGHISLINFKNKYNNIILSYFDFIYTQLILQNHLILGVFNHSSTIMWRQLIMRCGWVKAISINFNFLPNFRLCILKPSKNLFSSAFKRSRLIHYFFEVVFQQVRGLSNSTWAITPTPSNSTNKMSLA